MNKVLQHVIDAIGPASQAYAEAARTRVVSAGAPVLERLARMLGAAQHTPRPRANHRLIVVAAGDHGCGDPGIAMGADHPTIVAARAIADGSAALCQVARSGTSTPIVLVDAGAREPSHMPSIAIQLGRGPSRDLMREPAMTIVDAALGLEAGIALAISLAAPRTAESGTADARTAESRTAESRTADARTAESPIEVETLGTGPDLIVLGAIGVGSEVASAAILGGVSGRVPSGLGDDMAEAAGIRGTTLSGASGLELLAAFGGSETAVLAGLMLGAASMNVPVILDGYATGAAALIAAVLAPNVTGYLIAAHRGAFTQGAILDHLGLEPVFEVGLGHGEGTGAAMVLPLIDQVAALAGQG